ncbi:MAG: DUF4915 domain-containing protein [Ectobacillus sp.]
MIPIINCQLLVSCCNQNGGLYLINFQNRQYELKKVLHAECRGIAKYRNHFVAVSNKEGIFILDESLNIMKQKKQNEDLDLHGIAIDHNKAYIVETGTNSIGIYDLQNNIEKIDTIEFPAENNDTYHINDIFLLHDTLYISMFSAPPRKHFLPFVKPSPDKAPEQGAIIKYCLKTKKIIHICHDKLFQPHSVQLHKDDLYYCVSAKLQVKRNSEVIFNALGYTRGLALKNGTMFIGQSESRHIERLLQEHTNLLFDCGVYVHDIHTKLSSFIHIPAQEIYGLLVI